MSSVEKTTFPIKFAICIPTIGRESLRNTLESVLSQTQLGDIVIVIGDGHFAHQTAIRICKEFGPNPPLYLAKVPWFEPQNNWGHGPSNWGLDILKSHPLWTHYMRIDDDDVYSYNALNVIRLHVKKFPNRPLIFQMKFQNGNVIWKDNEHGIGHYGTPNFVIPRANEMPHWGTVYAGDFTFIQHACQMFGEAVWIPEITTVIRPHEKVV